MTVVALLIYGAIGAALAWVAIVWLQRLRRRQPLRCIAPYVANQPTPATQPPSAPRERSP